MSGFEIEEVEGVEPPPRARVEDIEVPADWSQLFDTGAGHSISALAVSGGKGYAAWCGPCWPGYVSETGFNRGLITSVGGSWQPLDLSNVPAGCDAIPNRYISGLAIDPRNSKHASLSLSGYARH